MLYFLGLLCFVFISSATTDKLKIYYFDVGQGDSQLIVYPSGYKVLIDMGPSPKRVHSRLQELLGKDYYIDVLVITHYHTDHYGSSDAIKNIMTKDDHPMRVGKILSRDAGYYIGNDLQSDCSQETLKDKYGKAVSDNKTAAKWLCFLLQYNGNLFDYIVPELNDTKVISSPNDPEVQSTIIAVDAQGIAKISETSSEENGRSIAIFFQYKTFTYFTGGDLNNEGSNEEVVANRVSSVDLYKVDHHGSETSSTEKFLNILSPQLSIAMCGTDNSYEHPRPECVERLYKSQTDFITTSNFCNNATLAKYPDYIQQSNGELTVETDGWIFTVASVNNPKINKTYKTKIYKSGKI